MQGGAGMNKGQRAEARALHICHALSNKGRLPVIGINPAPQFYDKRGVDIFVKLRLGDFETTVPIQVKSSSRGAKKFRRKYPKYTAVYHVVVIVVNNGRAEEEIEDELYDALMHILNERLTFVAFLEMLHTKGKRKDTRSLLQEQESLEEAAPLGLRKRVRFYRPQYRAHSSAR